jgi:hypothetical protein
MWIDLHVRIGLKACRVMSIGTCSAMFAELWERRLFQVLGRTPHSLSKWVSLDEGQLFEMQTGNPEVGLKDARVSSKSCWNGFQTKSWNWSAETGERWTEDVDRQNRTRKRELKVCHWQQDQKDREVKAERNWEKLRGTKFEKWGRKHASLTK